MRWRRGAAGRWSGTRAARQPAAHSRCAASLDRANSRYVLLEKVECLPDLTDSLVGVEGRVAGREDVGLMRMVPRSKPLDIHHCLPIGTATVVPANQEKDGGADVIDEVDRVPVAHQLGNVTRLSAKQRSIVGLEQRRKVLVAPLVISHRNTRDAATPQVRMLSQLEERHVTAPRVA